MSKLAPLDIVGDVSPCNQHIQVENQLIGSTVTVSVGNASISDTATSGRQTFKLPAAVNPGDTIVVSQSQAGFTPSNTTTKAVGAMATPAALSKGQFYTPFYRCAQCVWLYGCFAEASVEVLTNGNHLGKGEVGDDGQVEVHLERPLTGDDNLTAVLTDCKRITSAQAIVGGRPKDLPLPLLAPTVQQPLACDRSITVLGITPGAQVSVTRGGKSLGEFCVALPKLTIAPVSPLKIPPVDDSIVAQQAFPPKPCDVKSPPSKQADVLPNNPTPPTIKPPLCEGQFFVILDDMKKDATVELTVNGETLVLTAPGTFKKFTTDPLKPNTAVQARQNLCGDANSWSVWSPANNQVASVTPPKPVLVYPANGANPVAVNTQLTWNSPNSECNFPTSYDVQIATDSAFTRDLFQTNAPSPALTVPALKFQTQYFWRVQSNKGGRTSGYPAPFSFTTQQQHVPAPTGPGTPPPSGPRDYCFIETCFDVPRVIVISGEDSVEKAHQKAVDKAGSNCNVSDLDVPCKKQ